MLTRNPPNMAERRSVNVAMRLATAGFLATRLTAAHSDAAATTKSSSRPKDEKRVGARAKTHHVVKHDAIHRRRGRSERENVDHERGEDTADPAPWYPDRISRSRARRLPRRACLRRR